MNCLLIISYGIGDVLMKGGVLRLLSSYNCNVTILCESWGRKIFGDYPTIVYDPNDLEAAMPAVRAKDFDLVIETVPYNGKVVRRVWEVLAQEEKLSSLVRAKALKDLAMLNPLLLLQSYRSKYHTIRANHLFVQSLLQEKFGTAVSSEPVEAGYADMSLYGPPTAYSGKRQVVMHVGAQNYYWRHKAFPISMYRAISKWLQARGYEVFVVGSKDKIVAALQITDRQNVILGEPLDRVCELLGDSLCFIGDDCGPAHLAASIGVPTITFWGPTSPETTGPFGVPTWGSHHFIRGDAECSPCYFQKLFTSCKNPICQQVNLADFYKYFLEIENET